MSDRPWVLLTIWRTGPNTWGSYVWYWKPKTGNLRGSRDRLFRITRQIWGNPL